MITSSTLIRIEHRWVNVIGLEITLSLGQNILRLLWVSSSSALKLLDILSSSLSFFSLSLSLSLSFFLPFLLGCSQFWYIPNNHPQWVSYRYSDLHVFSRRDEAPQDSMHNLEEVIWPINKTTDVINLIGFYDQSFMLFPSHQLIHRKGDEITLRCLCFRCRKFCLRASFVFQLGNQ